MGNKTLAELRATFGKAGRVDWIGLRPARRQPLITPDRVLAIADHGLEGDRSAGKAGGQRQITLIQGEHIDAVAKMLGKENLDPALMRRNIVVRGINLLALKEGEVKIGNARIKLVKPCVPCSRMEENLGPGGYNAMRGHGGWCAVVLEGGEIKIGDQVELVQSEVGSGM